MATSSWPCRGSPGRSRGHGHADVAMPPVARRVGAILRDSFEHPRAGAGLTPRGAIAEVAASVGPGVARLMGDEHAFFVELVDHHGAAALAMLRRLCGNPHDADDVFQDV